MENFSIHIDNVSSPKYRRNLWIYFFLGLVWTVNGISVLLRTSFSDGFGLFYIVFGPLFIILAFLEKKNDQQFQISFDEKSISAKTSYFKAFKIEWTDLHGIGIENLKIILFTKSRLKKVINLDTLSYKSVKETKSKFIEAAKFNNIEIN